MRARSAAALVWLACCGPARPTDAGDAGSSGGTPGTTGTTPTSNVGSSGPTTSAPRGTSVTSDPASGVASLDGSSVTIDGDSSGSASTGPAPDLPPLDCDVWQQDCPAGMKCAPYAADGGSWWNTHRCVPVIRDPAQIDEPCLFVRDGVSGIDNCELGAFCWDDDDDDAGVCIELCKGLPEAPMCPPGFACPIWADAIVNLCWPSCDPLAQDCGDGLLCGPVPLGFFCLLDASGDGGQAHDPCVSPNDCDPGLHCAASSAAVECDEQEPRCCEPFCDLTAPNLCPGQGQVCTPYFEEGQATPEQEDIGLCAAPP